MNTSEPRTTEHSHLVLAPGHLQIAQTRRPTLSDPSNAPYTFAASQYNAEAIELAPYPDAMLFRKYGVICDADGTCVEQTTKAINFAVPNWRDRPLSAAHIKPEESLQGQYVYAAHGNYSVFAHVLFETLCTAFLLRSQLQKGDTHLLMPERAMAFSRPYLNLLGIPAQHVRAVSSRFTRVENLIVSSTVTGSNTFRPNKVMRDFAAYLRQHSGACRDGPRVKLYFTRSGKRGFAQRGYLFETQLAQELIHRGFSVIEPSALSLPMAIELLGRAEVVVGIHGSAFANLCFAPRGCKVLDILPQSMAQTNGAFTANLTNLFEHTYAYVISADRKEADGLTVTTPPVHILATLDQLISA